jgi:hypothetical protein
MSGAEGQCLHDFSLSEEDSHLARAGEHRDRSRMPSKASVEIVVDIVGRIAIVRPSSLRALPFDAVELRWR